MKSTRRKKYQEGESEEELVRRLFLTLLSIVGLAVFVGVSLIFFGPKIGSIFGLLSSHRNEKPNIPMGKPAPPVFTDLPTATNQEQLTVSGTSAPGYNVTLVVNGSEKASAITGADGIFSFSEIKLNSGRNTVVAKATDSEGNESENTQVRIVTLDTQTPKLEIESPKDGETIRNLDKRVLVKGKINEAAEVKIGNSIVILNEGADGGYVFDYLLGVNEGSNKIKVEAKDEAGNSTSKEITVKYEKRGI